MTDSAALKQLIASKGLKLSFVAKHLDLSPYGFSLKLYNKNEFKTGEIVKLCELLGITSIEERDKIFFANKDDLESSEAIATS